MKRMFGIICLITCNMFAVSAQEQPHLGCKDAVIAAQSAELKSSLVQQGFELQNDAMIGISSSDGFPVVTRMQGGEFYQIVFIGNTRARKMRLSLYDPQMKLQVAKEQRPLQQTSNVINFSFTPPSDGNYRIELEQHMQSSMFRHAGESCGSISIFRLKKEKKTSK